MEFEVEDENTNPDVIDLGDNSAELVPIQRKKTMTHAHEEEDDKMYLGIQQTVRQIDRFQTVSVVFSEKIPISCHFDKKIFIYAIQGNIIQSMSEDYGEGGNPKWEIDAVVKSEIMEGSNSGKSDEEIQVLECPRKAEYDTGSFLMHSIHVLIFRVQL